MRRRSVLVAVAAGAVSTTGCLGSNALTSQVETTPQDTTTTDDDLTEWERSTDCDGMHDSVIKVAWVTASLRDAFDPIAFSDLTAEEQALLETVVTQGGVGTCDPSAAFVRFVQRVAERWTEQREDGDGPTVVALEHRGRYYGLSVEKTDQVFSG